MAALPVRMAWALWIWVMGVGFAVGTWIHGYWYINEIALEDTQQKVVVGTMG